MSEKDKRLVAEAKRTGSYNKIEELRKMAESEDARALIDKAKHNLYRYEEYKTQMQ